MEGGLTRCVSPDFILFYLWILCGVVNGIFLLVLFRLFLYFSTPYKSPTLVSRSPTLSGPDLNFLCTFGTNEPLQDNRRLCHLSLSSFFQSLLSSLSCLHLKYTNPDPNANFSGSPAAALQLLLHDMPRLITLSDSNCAFSC